MRKVLASELRPQADLLSLDEQFLLQVDIAEGTSGPVSGGGETVIVFDAGELDSEKILLRRSAADHESDVIRRAGRGTKAAHLLHQERKQGALVLDGGLRHWIEIGLVRAAAALGYHDETVFVAFDGFQVYLGGQVAAGIHLVVHVQRCVLAVTEILLCICIEHAHAQSLLVFETSPNLLALLAVDDGGTGVLAEREHSLHRSFGVAEELQGDVFVVLAGFRVFQDSGHLLVVGAAEHELTIVETLPGHECKGLGSHLEHPVAFEIGCGHKLLRTGNPVVFGAVLPQLEHGSVFKLCHISSALKKIS